MIDRLEELLQQVEEPEEDGEILVLRQPFGRAAAEKEPQADEPLSVPMVNAAETAANGQAAQRVKAKPVLFRRTIRREGGSGLAGLYRQLSRSLEGEGSGRPASVAVVHEVSSVPAAGLTAGELDLAMRRDSRRYDGGMTIY